MSISIGFKSPATISQAQATAQYDGTAGSLAARGRHDPCVVPRAVPIVEGMASLVIMDQLLVQNARVHAVSHLPPTVGLPPSMAMPKMLKAGSNAPVPGQAAADETLLREEVQSSGS